MTKRNTNPKAPSLPPSLEAILRGAMQVDPKKVKEAEEREKKAKPKRKK